MVNYGLQPVDLKINGLGVFDLDAPLRARLSLLPVHGFVEVLLDLFFFEDKLCPLICKKIRDLLGR